MQTGIGRIGSLWGAKFFAAAGAIDQMKMSLFATVEITEQEERRFRTSLGSVISRKSKR